MSEQPSAKKHVLCITERKNVEISGVDAILAFEEDYIDISTSLGRVTLEGSDLKVLDLSKDKGSVSIQGVIKSVIFSDSPSKKKRGFFT